MNTLSLCGEYTVHSHSGYRKTPPVTVTVPGTVQEAYIPMLGAPEKAHNVLSYRWIEECLWIFEKTFTFSPTGSRTRLVFEGLDLTAAIYLNGKEVGRHNNYYTPCVCDVTDAVREGENTLKIELDSGLHYAAAKDVTRLNPAPYEHGTWLHKRLWMRKPQYFGEWDWSPRLFTVGIHGDCRIESGEAFPDGLFVQTRLENATGFVDAAATVDGDAPATLTATVRQTGETVCVSGTGTLSLTAAVPQPQLWYPVGYGEQPLYDVTFTLSAGGDTLAVWDRQVGFRQVEILQQPLAEGKSFILTVNGQKIFAKGGDFVPADILPTRITDETYETLIDRALESGFNTLRVWGGGLYESETFYRLCDRRGILIWQDMIFACGYYPTDDPEFFENVCEELTFQLRRLAAHPALAVLCGNNELDWGEHCDRVCREHPLPRPDRPLFYETIPAILRDNRITLPYVPSSPWSPEGDPNDCHIGDQHPWGVGFANKQYYDYRTYTDRFADEGGMLGSVSLPATELCLGNETDKAFDWALHDNSIHHDFPYTEMLAQVSGKDPAAMTTAEFVYYAGVMKSEALTEYVLNYRRRKFDSAAAIFWMFNDCWPTILSWTTVDYLQNRTPAFYPVKRAMQTAAVDIVKTEQGFTVYGISDALCTLTGTLEYGTFTPAGDYVTHTLAVSLPANASTPLAAFEAAEGTVPYAILHTEQGEARRRYITGSPADYAADTPITVTVDGDTATYCCERFVPAVCIDLSGRRLSDNLFDLFPGKPHTVQLCGSTGEVLFRL